MTFEQAWAAARDVEGWLTEAQARRLFRAAAGVGAGGDVVRVVEIGSFRGRSAIVLASAGADVVCIDPHAGSDRGPQEIAADADRGAADLEAFRANLARAGVGDRVPPRARLLRRGAGARSRDRSTCSSSTAPTASARPARTSCAGASASAPAGACSCTTRGRRSASPSRC